MKGTKLAAVLIVAAIAASGISPAVSQADNAESGGEVQRQVLVFPENGGSIGPGGVELELTKIGEDGGVSKYAPVQKSPTGETLVLNGPNNSLVLPPVSQKAPAPPTAPGQPPQDPGAPQMKDSPMDAMGPQQAGPGIVDPTGASVINSVESSSPGSSPSPATDDETGGSSSGAMKSSPGAKGSSSSSGTKVTSTGKKGTDTSTKKDGSKSSSDKKDGKTSGALSNATGALNKTLLTACLALSAVLVLV